MPAPEDPHALAETENGKVLEAYTFADVEIAFKVLILNGGNVKKTLEILADEGLSVERITLRDWRERMFPQRYRELRYELGAVVSEEMAGRAMERAMQADDAEDQYLAMAIEKLDEVSPDKLAPGVLALSKAKAENISKAQLLRERPTEIREVRDTAELLDVLRRAGVLNRDPVAHTDIEAEVLPEPQPEEGEELRKRISARLRPSE
jgi:hypothetical protein